MRREIRCQDNELSAKVHVLFSGAQVFIMNGTGLMWEIKRKGCDCISAVCVCVCVHVGHYRTSLSGGFICFWFLVMLRQWGSCSDLILYLLIKMSSQVFSSRSLTLLFMSLSCGHSVQSFNCSHYFPLEPLKFAICPFENDDFLKLSHYVSWTEPPTFFFILSAINKPWK